jgi:hypothetical protein
VLSGILGQVNLPQGLTLILEQGTSSRRADRKPGNRCGVRWHAVPGCRDNARTRTYLRSRKKADA